MKSETTKSSTRKRKPGVTKKLGAEKKGKLNRKIALRLRSGLEEKVAQQLDTSQIEYTYEERAIEYTIPASKHSYTPDFILKTKSGKELIIETKGIWDYEDRYKHLLIRQQHPDLDIRFVFQRPNQRIKRGSSTSYRDICEGRGRGIFKGYTWPWSSKRIPEEWLEE